MNVAALNDRELESKINFQKSPKKSKSKSRKIPVENIWEILSEIKCQIILCESEYEYRTHRDPNVSTSPVENPIYTLSVKNSRFKK